VAGSWGKAEGKGFEPSTGCPAPDFESGCQESATAIASTQYRGRLLERRYVLRAIAHHLAFRDFVHMIKM
jgi:hypothetical protein